MYKGVNCCSELLPAMGFTRYTSLVDKLAQQNNRNNSTMHVQISLRFVLTGIFTLMISACTNVSQYIPAQVESRDVKQSQPVADSEDSSGGIDQGPDLRAQDLDLQRARQYQSQAQNSPVAAQRIDAALNAAEYYIQGQDFNQAEQVISTIERQYLSQLASDRLIVIQAYISYSRDDFRTTLELLRPLWERTPAPVDESQNNNDTESQAAIIETPTLSVQQMDALLLASLVYQRADDYDSAIAALIRRERGLRGASRTETTRYIWQVINSLSLTARQQIIQTTPNALVRNRIEQSLNSEIGRAPLKPSEFGQWRDPDLNVSSQIIDSQWNAQSPQNIAVLLPSNSRFAKAAQAVMDGIKYQHEQNNSSYRPEIRFYDLGESAFNTSQYYNAAVQSGSDFIIGPLGKDYANQLSSYSAVGSVPTVLLGGDAPLNANTQRFATTPELEGVQIAERAWKDGHLSAAVMRATSTNSRRTVEAFRQRWLELGGKIAAIIDYSPKQFDHSVELKQLFSVNQSKYRHTQLSSVLGFQPKFSAYQRADIDFVLMLADNKMGRLLRPQINFYSGSKIPVYSGSNVYNGIQDSVNNIDLNKTRFPVMPWVIASSEVAPYAGQLNRLFALGADAYQLAATYQTLRRDPVSAFDGLTGKISIASNRNVIIEPAWARFEQGEATIIDNNGIDIRPVSAPNRFANGRQGTNRENSYNQDTWDADKSVRRRPFYTEAQNDDD